MSVLFAAIHQMAALTANDATVAWGVGYARSVAHSRLVLIGLMAKADIANLCKTIRL